MQTENNIKPVLPAFLQSDPAQLNQNRETFHDIFQRSLNQVSGSRPPKIELTGLLVPFSKVIRGQHCKFKLETDSDEYFLSMNDSLSLIAKKVEWDEVTVKGFLDNDESLFEVEKISLAPSGESVKLSTVLSEPYFDLELYKRTIAQRGKLDLAPDYLAS